MTVWFESTEPADATVDLFVFPHAGGSPAAYRSWRGAFPSCRVHIAALPGRGARYAEAPVARFDALVDALVPALESVGGRRTVLFGHSLGALVAFEVARRLRRPPVAVVVSGADGPGTRAANGRRRRSDAELVEEVRRLGGTPDEVLGDPEVLAFMLPTLRADFSLVDSYRFVPGPALSSPVHVIGGDDDPDTGAAGLLEWRAVADAPVDVRTFPGGHFFVHEEEEAVLRHVRDIVSGRRPVAHVRPLGTTW